MKKILVAVPFLVLSLFINAQVDRYPVIQSPSQTSVVIAWNTATAGIGTVQWGTSAGSLSNTLTEPSAIKIHAITITGLQPNTHYYYKAITSAGYASSVEDFFTAKPDSVRNLKFNVYGDCGFNNTQQNTMAALMATKTVDFSLVVGDVDQNVGNDYDTRFFQRYTNQLKHFCHFTAIGNHDVITNNTNYTDAFVLPHNNPANSEKYYSFTWGNAKFITIDGNSAYTAGSAQYIWLENELKCNNSEWTFVYFHQPPWSNGWDVSYYIPLTPFYMYQGNTDMRTSIVPLFERYHVDFVLNGHTHHYESGVYNGVHYIITGGGGAATPDSHTNSNSPNIQFEKDVNNYVNFAINGDSIKYVAYDLNGAAFDSIKLTKTFTPYSATVSTTDNVCYGNTNGTAVLQVAGPHPGYSYRWSNGNTTANPTQLAAGNYTVTITDVNGCTQTNSAIINQPTQITATPTITAPLCYGGTDGAVTVLASGGTGTLQYAWSNNTTSANLNNIVAGQYTLAIYDANQCADTLQATVTQPAALTSTVAVTNPLCFGDVADLVNLTASGGTTGYTYHWSNGSSANQLSSVAAGNYYVTITDAHNCMKIDSATIVAPSPITATATPTDVLCSGGSSGNVALNIAGGTGTYVYLWNNGATTASLANVSAGQYTLAIADGNGCRDTVRATVSQPTALTAHIDTVGLTCFGDHTGSANLVATGGNGTYTYRWNTGTTTQGLSNIAAGSYGGTVTDANGCTKGVTSIVRQPAQLVAVANVTPITCNGSNNGVINVAVSGGSFPYTYNWATGETTSGLSSLSAGQYTVYIADNNGCKDTLTQNLSQPNSIGASQVVTPATCNGGTNGSVFINPSGGVSPYSYAWNTGDTTQSITVAAGNYDGTVTDAHGCSKTIQASVTEPTALQVQDSVKNAYCANGANGKVILSVSGGNTPYTYHWTNNVNPNALDAGTYAVTITDGHNCTTTRTYTITAQGGNVRPQLAYPVSQICNGDSITLQTSASFASYQWSNGANNNSIVVSAAGNYYVAVADSFGCTGVSDTLSLAVNTIPHLSITASTSLLTTHLHVSQPGAANYTWNLGNGATVNDTTGTIDYTYTDSGNYVVQLISAYPCGNDTATYEVYVADTTTGIIYLDGKVVNVSLEPNPFSEVTTLIFDQATGQSFHMTLFDLGGKLVRDMGYNYGTTITIRRGNLANGVYLLNISGDKFNKTLKLVVE